MNYNELAKFEYKGKTYVYYTLPDKPKNLLYGYLENNEIKLVVDPDDIAIMQEAYKKIFISNNSSNHVKLGTTIHNGKLFQIMYDKASELKFFYEMKAGQYLLPSENEAKELFEIFNISNPYTKYADKSDFSYVANDKRGINNPNSTKGNKKNKLLKKIIGFVGGVIAVTFIAGGLLFDEYIAPAYPNSAIVSTIVKLKEGSFSETRLTEAIKSNPNLNDKEKEIFYAKIPILQKYQKYVNFRHVENKFKTVSIKYIEGNDPENPCIGAYYSRDDNQIVAYNSTSIDDCDLSYLSHEANHCTSEPHGSLGNSMYEATTEGISFEQEYSPYFAYYQECLYERILMQIIGSEVFAADHYSGDESYITKALQRVIPDEEMAIQLLHEMDSINSNNFQLYNKVDFNDPASQPIIDELQTNIAESSKIVLKLLDEYFTAAKGYHMGYDAIVLSYVKALGKSNEPIYVFSDDPSISDAEIIDSMPKVGYFVDTYIQKYPTASLKVTCYIDYMPQEFTGGVMPKIPQIVDMPINDSNRELALIADGFAITMPSESISDTKMSFGSGLQKGLTEVINEEENYKEAREFNNYKEQATYVKILCELIGVEPFERYLANGDINEIIDALCNVIPDRQAALELIGKIDVTMSYYEQLVDTSKPAESKVAEMAGDIDENLTAIRGEIYTSLYIYFNKKDPDNGINGNVIVNTYYRELTTEFSFECSGHVWPVAFIMSSNEIINAGSYESASVVKAYFDPAFKEESPVPYIEIKFEGDTLNSRFTIDENGEPVTRPKTEIIFVDEHNIRMEQVLNGTGNAYCEYFESSIKRGL